MVRVVSALALAVALAFGGAFVSGTFSDAAAKSKLGLCKKTTLLGKAKTWTCKSGEYCCSAPILGYYGCGAKKLFGCVKI
jgi:hypothetical protein